MAIDTDAVRKLVLFTENDGDIYSRQTRPTIENLAKKLKRGTFDVKKAEKAFLYVANAGAKKYAFEFGDRGGARSWHRVSLRAVPFTSEDRKAAAAELLENYLEEIEDEADQPHSTSVRRNSRIVWDKKRGAATSNWIPLDHGVMTRIEIVKQGYGRHPTPWAAFATASRKYGDYHGEREERTTVLAPDGRTVAYSFSGDQHGQNMAQFRTGSQARKAAQEWINSRPTFKWAHQ